VPAGDAVSDVHRVQLARAIETADRATGLRFRVVVGALDADAASRHPVEPIDVLVAVDPISRRLEIVTGSRAGQQISDRVCGLASLAMTSSFAAGDLIGGLRNGIQVLADHGRRERTPHLETL